MVEDSVTFSPCGGRDRANNVNFRNSSVANWCFVFVKVNILGENNSSLDIEFNVRETTCRKDSGADPATCDFQSGYYVVRVMGRAILFPTPPPPIPQTNMRQHLIFFHDCHSKSLAVACWPAILEALSVSMLYSRMVAVLPSGWGLELWVTWSWMILANYLASVAQFPAL